MDVKIGSIANGTIHLVSHKLGLVFDDFNNFAEVADEGIDVVSQHTYFIFGINMYGWEIVCE